MKNLRVQLHASAEQGERLSALQARFAQACNALAPTVQQTRVWNRVALHHLCYRTLREQFPALGSQMVCNAIYSVSKIARLVYQHPSSPFNLERLNGKPLPLLRFAHGCPVYFDRHTLSVRRGQLSMFTLDGRMRFQVALDADAQQAFAEKKLREVVLRRRAPQVFELSFWFSDPDEEVASETNAPAEALALSQGEIPDYVLVEEVL